MEFMCANGIDMNDFLDRIYIGIQRIGGAPIAKRPTEFDGIEQYLWVKLDKERSFKVPASFETETLWEVAKRNTFAETKITSLAEILSEALGFEVPEMEPAQYVLTNKSGFRGAACALDRIALKAFADHLGVNGFFILPSSIHEVIIIPYTDEDIKGDFDRMVRQVNETQVDYKEQLADESFIIRF